MHTLSGVNKLSGFSFMKSNAVKQGLRKHVNHLVQLPDSFSSVSTLDCVHEIDPEKVGMASEGIDDIWRAVEGAYKTGTYPGISLHMRRRGQVIIDRSIGHARGNGPQAKAHDPKILMRPATPVCYFSASKAVTAFLMHLLSEDKLIHLHDPISFYAPEFGQKGKRNVTVHQVLAHRAGVPGLPEGVPVDALWDNDEIWRLLCATEPKSAKGHHLAYHALTGGYILERVLQKVTGMTIQDFLDKRVRQPMGMKYFRYGIEDKYADRLADNSATGMTPFFPLSKLIARALGGSLSMVEQVTNDPRFKQAVIPAGNIMGTAEEMGRFFQMLLDGGMCNGKRICEPMTVKRFTQEYSSIQFDKTLMLPMRYSAGLMLGGEPFGMWGKHSGSAFGHIGLINKLCWADPDRDISVSLLTTGIPIVAMNIPALIRFMNKIDQHCPRDGEARF